MYNTQAFRDARPEVLQVAIRKYPLATLVTVGSRGIEASHIPLLLHDAGDGAFVLRGHVARANPQWQEYLPETEALAIFDGPRHYITPAWYPAKAEHGKVVPTWNFVTCMRAEN